MQTHFGILLSIHALLIWQQILMAPDKSHTKTELAGGCKAPPNCSECMCQTPQLAICKPSSCNGVANRIIENLPDRPSCEPGDSWQVDECGTRCFCKNGGTLCAMPVC